ncbi:MAG: hypothetical protein LBI73_00465 [Myroides sp.]|jgi:hypothetical protein|nr:hypothetical protein [Myroides sp.]
MSSLLFAQAPTDWQVYQLKGQVKKMTVIRTSENGNIEREEIEFDRQGYKTFKTFFKNNVEWDSVSKEMRLITKERYLPYIDNKRSIMVRTGKEEKEKYGNDFLFKNTEYWSSNGQHIIISRGDVYEEHCKEVYNNENKLLSRETDLLITLGSSKYHNITKYIFTYDKKGELVRTDIKVSEDGEEKEGYQIFEVQKRDRYGNIVQRVLKDDTGKTFYVENFTINKR